MKTGARRDPPGVYRPAFWLLRAKGLVRMHSLPAAAEIRQAPVTEQLVQSCLAHSTSGGVWERLCARGTPLAWVPSTDVLYRLSRAVARGNVTAPDSTLPALGDDGSYPFCAAQALETWGIRASRNGLQSDDDPGTVCSEPFLDDLETSSETVLVGAHRIYLSNLISDLKASIAAGIPVTSTEDVGARFSDWKPTDAPLRLDDAMADIQASMGLHSTRFNAYRTEADGTTVFRKQNSWGTGYGDNGCVWVHESWVKFGCDHYALDVQIVRPV